MRPARIFNNGIAQYGQQKVRTTPKQDLRNTQQQALANLPLINMSFAVQCWGKSTIPAKVCVIPYNAKVKSQNAKEMSPLCFALVVSAGRFVALLTPVNHTQVPQKFFIT